MRLPSLDRIDMPVLSVTVRGSNKRGSDVLGPADSGLRLDPTALAGSSQSPNLPIAAAPPGLPETLSSVTPERPSSADRASWGRTNRQALSASPCGSRVAIGGGAEREGEATALAGTSKRTSDLPGRFASPSGDSGWDAGDIALPANASVCASNIARIRATAVGASALPDSPQDNCCWRRCWRCTAGERRRGWYRWESGGVWANSLPSPQCLSIGKPRLGELLSALVLQGEADRLGNGELKHRVAAPVHGAPRTPTRHRLPGPREDNTR